jgi:hypothetical protein
MQDSYSELIKLHNESWIFELTSYKKGDEILHHLKEESRFPKNIGNLN